MAESIAAAGVAFAVAPCVKAICELVRDANGWKTITRSLYFSSRAQSTRTLSKILRVLNKCRATLERDSRILPAGRFKDFVEKNIDLYNDLVTMHSAADAKTRLVAVRVAEEASIRLFKDIKKFTRKCANDRLGLAIKTCLSYDPNVTYPDGTIAPYHLNGDHHQPLLPQTIPTPIPPYGSNDEPHLSFPQQSALRSVICFSPSPCPLQQYYIPTDVFAHPWALSMSPCFPVSQPGTSTECHRSPAIGFGLVNNSGDAILPADSIVPDQNGEAS
ncbi:hypothetical protein DL96DRAFT_1711211 [Flagelloscypha sp. PMI_526]|nr:hypothetical protein DL96DRAFT_1711211 [Flagelloscypha sp. PMI_526]